MTAQAKRGLGKGLSALMGEEYSHTVSIESEEAPSFKLGGLTDLDITLIHSGAFQPRTHFSEEYLNELADSIEKNGVMQPIIVRPSRQQNGHFEIIAGERRWRASKLAKMEKIPAIVRDIDDQTALELALVENVQRQDLTPLEEAAGYQRLVDEFAYTQETLARTVGKSRSHIANLLRLLNLPDEIKAMLDKAELTMGHARTLISAENPLELAKKIVKEGLNVRQAEALLRGDTIAANDDLATTSLRKEISSAPRRRNNAYKDPDILALEDSLSENLGLKVSIDDFGNQQGEIVISYQSLTQLDEVLRRLSDSI